MTKPIAVKFYMAKDLITFSPEMDVLDAIQILITHKISGAPVVDKRGNLIGLLSEKDCMQVALNANYYGGRGGQVEEFMTHHVKVMEADNTIVEVAEKFGELPYRRYPVVDNNRLVGQISRRDVLRALQEIGADLRPYGGQAQHPESKK